MFEFNWKLRIKISARTRNLKVVEFYQFDDFCPELFTQQLGLRAYRCKHAPSLSRVPTHSSQRTALGSDLQRNPFPTTAYPN